MTILEELAKIEEEVLPDVDHLLEGVYISTQDRVAAGTFKLLALIIRQNERAVEGTARDLLATNVGKACACRRFWPDEDLLAQALASQGREGGHLVVCPLGGP
jgi:hypothetical protein